MSDNIQEMYARARKAFETVEFWSQDSIDEVVAAVGWELQKQDTREDLARTAVEESGMGVYEDKRDKIKTKTLGTLRDFYKVKTCGLMEDDVQKGVQTYAKPIGVVANVVPCTNPESTVCCLGLSSLKTRNAMIVSPHPRTQATTYKAVEYIRKALTRVGAPVDLMQCIKNTSHEKTQELMTASDYAIATGGDALIKVVYKAGKPAQTVGAGNVVTIVDDTVDIRTAAQHVAFSKTVNNAASCSSDNAVAIQDTVYDQMMAGLQEEGGYLCSTEEREKLRQAMWPDGKALNRDIVAKPAQFIADLAGIDVPEGTRFLMILGEKVGPEDRFSGEKLSPVLTVWNWLDFYEIVDRVKQMHKFSGEGHSVNIHSNLEDRRVYLALNANVGRVICNMAHAAANSGGWKCGLDTTDTLGCGTWAGNISSENINWRQFLNFTRLAVPIPENMPTEEMLFRDHIKKWGRD
ncbi:MAG: aldehyde dehydrogenase family protein [Desulfohalobiaceae bacterium]|nr:aldehyde dehydrogenase family protein [Desulfohalobiaceae bacterium]